VRETRRVIRWRGLHSFEPNVAREGLTCLPFPGSGRDLRDELPIFLLVHAWFILPLLKRAVYTVAHPVAWREGRVGALVHPSPGTTSGDLAWQGGASEPEPIGGAFV
jgi:hypothetical protein